MLAGVGTSAALLLLVSGLGFGLDWVTTFLGILLAACILTWLAAKLWVRSALPRPTKGVVAFFHPFADGGGGGERVLWVAVQALQRARPSVKIAVYSGAGLTPAQLCEHAAERFNLGVQPTFEVVPLARRALLQPERYPRLTMLRQAVGSVRVALEGLRQLVPEVYVDTTGWAFPYPLVAMAGARVAAYVHYPTISTDMLDRVEARAASYNNSDQVSGSLLLSTLKLLYYNAFAAVYGLAGGFASVVMVNSSWTRRHVGAIWWWQRTPPARVYPPCDTEALRALPLDRRLKRLYLLSLAQFRPEKDHALQLRALAAARGVAARMHSRAGDSVLAARLQLVGSCRGAGDEARIEGLRALAAELGLSDHVEFHVNVPFPELKALLGDAVAGLHTMVDEHFGISVVEYMAAGMVPIAHDSAGPREDIVVPEPAEGGGPPQSTGYRCSTLEGYAAAIVEVLGMEQLDRMRIAAAARRRSAMFSDRRFEEDFVACMAKVLPGEERGG